MGEADALPDEATAQTAASGDRIYQQRAQLRGHIVFPHAEHATHALARQLGDPGSLRTGIPFTGEVSDGLSYQRLEASALSVLRVVELAVR